jgi:hypothetical protein
MEGEMGFHALPHCVRFPIPAKSGLSHGVYDRKKREPQMGADERGFP